MTIIIVIHNNVRNNTFDGNIQTGYLISSSVRF